jgi:hypothetical protein
MRIGPCVPPPDEMTPGDCPECGQQCAPECGMHPLGCIFGGGWSCGYWLIVEGCDLDHGERT